MLYETYPDYISTHSSVSSVGSVRSVGSVPSVTSFSSNMTYPSDKSRYRRKAHEMSLLDTASVPANSMRMLGLVVSHDPHRMNKGQGRGDGSWVAWVNYLKSHDPNLCVKEAALLHTRTGLIVAASKTFNITSDDAKTLRQLFEDNRLTPESIHVGERTYCIKSKSDSSVVAFYGGSYLIVAQAQKLIVVAVCTSRTKCNEATAFVQKVADKLSKSNSKEC